MFAAGSALTYLGYGITLLCLAGVSLAAITRLILKELAIVVILTAILVASLWNLSSDVLKVLIAVAFGAVAMFRIKPALKRLAAHA